MGVAEGGLGAAIREQKRDFGVHVIGWFAEEQSRALIGWVGLQNGQGCGRTS